MEIGDLVYHKKHKPFYVQESYNGYYNNEPTHAEVSDHTEKIHDLIIIDKKEYIVFKHGKGKSSYLNVAEKDNYTCIKNSQIVNTLLKQAKLQAQIDSRVDKEFRVKSLSAALEFNNKTLEVGCQRITKKDALLIAKEIQKRFK